MLDAAVDLKDKIDGFLTSSGMSPTVFGREVLNDPNFVFDLRSGKRSPSIRTVEKIYAYIDTRIKKPSKVGIAFALAGTAHLYRCA